MDVQSALETEKESLPGWKSGAAVGAQWVGSGRSAAAAEGTAWVGCTRQLGNWRCIGVVRGRSTGNLSGVSGEEAGKWAVLRKSLGSLTQENGFNPLRVSAGMEHRFLPLLSLPPSFRPCAEGAPEGQRDCGLLEVTGHISCWIGMRAQCPWLSRSHALCSGLACPCCLTPSTVLWVLSRVTSAAVASG